MKKTIILLLPADNPTGPIKGAFAIANGLSKYYFVQLVFINKGKGSNAFLEKEIAKEYLSESKKNFFKNVKKFREFIKYMSTKNKNILVFSMCFSADLTNFISLHKFPKVSSIRGNLMTNYKFTYGFLGYCLALLHLFILRNFSLVFSMTLSMQSQVNKLVGLKTEVVPNFIDEKNLDLYKYENRKFKNKKKFNLLFLGSLTKRKNPELLIDAISKINKYDLKLDIIGGGELEKRIANLISRMNLDSKIKLIGFVKNPFKRFKNYDILVLPSSSEGTSRAVLESLFMGLTCVLRDTDGNSELSLVSENVFLFRKDEELSKTIEKAIEQTSKKIRKMNFLPSKYSQSRVSQEMFNRLDKIF